MPSPVAARLPDPVVLVLSEAVLVLVIAFRITKGRAESSTIASTSTKYPLALARGEETRLMFEAEVEQKRPLRRQEAQAQYQQYLLRRLSEAPPPEPIPDLAGALSTIPAELLPDAPAEEVR